MLKKIWRLFLGLVVLTGSACVTPTHASSAPSVIVTYVQATGLAGAKDEMVALYNNSSEGVDITNWCLFNKSGDAFVCFTPEDASQGYYLPAHSAAIVATSLFLESMQLSTDAVTKLFEPAASSGGSIVNSGDTITLVNADDEVVDEVSWEEGIGAGKVAVRNTVAEDPLVYETDEGKVVWLNLSLESLQVPENQVELYTLPPADDSDNESEDNEGGESEDVGNAEGEDDTEGGAEASVPLTHPTITELLPNPDGSDTGNEFIELHNSTSEAITLEKYRIRVGPQLEKVYDFPADSVLTPGEYTAFSNSQIKFTLLNSQSNVQLEYEGELVGAPVFYEKPPSGHAWALIGQVWQYTDTPTPAYENSASLSLNVEAKSEAKSSTSSLKPCAANQYRHPETNRCRLLATSSGEPAPCKEGQERNPETNRCRAIVKMTNAEHAVKGAVTTQEPVNWYFWLGIAGVVVLIVGYGVWEWRDELKKGAMRVWHTFARTKH